MSESFTNFAKLGDPNFTSDGSTKVEWKRYQKSGSFLNFGSELTFEELCSEVRDRIDFWNEVVVKEGRLLSWKKSEAPIPKIHDKPAGKRRE
jgi:hypothetical protein